MAGKGGVIQYLGVDGLYSELLVTVCVAQDLDELKESLKLHSE